MDTRAPGIVAPPASHIASRLILCCGLLCWLQRLDPADLVPAGARPSCTQAPSTSACRAWVLPAFGDAAEPDGLATQLLSSDQAEIGREPSWIGEAREVADLPD